MCVWGAWMVSVGCLDGLGVIWDTSMGDKIVILNEKVQSLSYNSHTTFSPSAHFLAKIKRNFWSKSTYSPGFIHKTAPKNAWERSTLNQSPPYLGEFKGLLFDNFSSRCISRNKSLRYILLNIDIYIWNHQIYTKQQCIFVQTKVNIENAAFCFDRGCPRPPFWFQTLKGCPRPAPISQLCI